MYYASLEKVVRCYGGPEEGGWWYDRNVPVKVFACKKRIARKAWKHYQAEADRLNSEIRYDRFSVLGHSDFEAVFSKEKPHDSGVMRYE